MEALSVRIINPKVKSILLDLEEMDLIRIETKPAISEILARLRCNESEMPSLEEITEEVEWVRKKRYDAKMQNNH